MSKRPISYCSQTPRCWRSLDLLPSLLRRCQQQPLPDAPAPQNKRLLPRDQCSRTQGRLRQSTGIRFVIQCKPEQPANTPAAGSRQNRKRLRRARRRSRRFLPGSVPNSPESGRDQLFSLIKNVSFVTVPVTVKDSEGKMVDGLLQKDFTFRRRGAAEDHVLHQRSISACRRR